MRMLLVLAILLTAGLLPMTYQIAAHNGRDGQPAGFGILVLCLLRAATLIAARPSLLNLLGILILEAAALQMHLLSIDYQLTPLAQRAYGLLATAIPLTAIAALYLSHRLLFAGAIVAAASAGLFGLGAYDALTREWRAARMQTPQPEPPKNATIETLLPLTRPSQPYDTASAARDRIDQLPNSTQHLLDLLSGPQALDALYLLKDRQKTLPEPSQDLCWTALGAIARGMPANPSEAAVQQLHRAAQALAVTPSPLRTRHLADLTAARDAVRAANAKGISREDTAWLDATLAH